MAASLVTMALGAPQSQAQSQDALLDKLVSKGVLTQTEAEQLKDEADSGYRKAFQAKTGMPDWVTSLKMGGDFRARYENFTADKFTTDATPVPGNRQRYRYRLRYGVVATLNDNIEIGFRLASGDATAAGGLIDPISTNQTLGDNGAKKGIYIDLAYAKWTPINSSRWQMVLTGGKMENPFVVSDIVFDGDYTPEGAAIATKYSFNDKHAARLIGGAFLLEETSGNARDAYMIGAQARFDSNWDQKLKWQSTLGLGVFSIANDESLVTGSVPNFAAGNDRTGGGNLVEGMNPLVADAGITYSLETFPFYSGKFPIRLAGDYVHNPAAQRDSDAFSLGLTFGKSGKRKTWDLSYRWKEIQANAWYEEVLDSDSGGFYTTAPTGGGSGYRSGSNIRGHQIKAAYSPYDSFTLGVTYGSYDVIKENPVGSGSHIGRLQVDAVLKF